MEQELQRFLETNIPSHDQNKSKGHHGIDPAPTPRPNNPPGLWANFNSKEELWEFLKTVISHNDNNKGQDCEETDLVTNRHMGQGSRDKCTSNKKQRTQDKQKDQPTNKIRQRENGNKCESETGSTHETNPDTTTSPENE